MKLTWSNIQVTLVVCKQEFKNMWTFQMTCEITLRNKRTGTIVLFDEKWIILTAMFRKKEMNHLGVS